MPDTTSTLIHYSATANTGGLALCGAAKSTGGGITADPGYVTCFACRNSTPFKSAQRGVEPPTPIKLSGVMARSEEIAELGREARRRTRDGSRNDGGMYTIEEVIHHGDYRSVRRVEVYAINETTVDAVLQSSAYCYGSWKHPENISHREHRNTALAILVEDLKAGRENRSIGWSTFRMV